jgi:hypothetical protein
MIARTHALPIVRQCQLLTRARATADDQPTPGSEPERALMCRIAELQLQYPVAGARMLRERVRRAGHAIGRRHVAPLMRRMGLAAGYRKPHLSHRHPAHTVSPYPCATWRARVPSTSGPPRSPPFRWHGASCTCVRFSTGRGVGGWRGGCPIHGRPTSAWRLSRTPEPIRARQRSSTPSKAASSPARSSRDD